MTHTPKSSGEAKITMEEMVELFGPTMPIAASKLLMEPPKGWTIARLREELSRIASSSVSAEAEFVLVPRKPTEAMLDAWSFTWGAPNALNCWRAMLAAAPPPRPSSDTIGGGEHAGLIEEYRNLVKTGAEYAASELRLAPTSAFEIYMGHFRDIGRDIEAALSALQAPQYTGEVEEWQGLETAPHACHVLATRFDHDAGEWVIDVVLSPPIYPFTHWMNLPPSPQNR